MEANEKADEIRMKVRTSASLEGGLLVGHLLRPARHLSRVIPYLIYIQIPLHHVCLQTKADADSERTLQVTTRRNKLAEEYDKKERQLAVDNGV